MRAHFKFTTLYLLLYCSHSFGGGWGEALDWGEAIKKRKFEMRPFMKHLFM
jgi:hypothetical protein